MQLVRGTTKSSLWIGIGGHSPQRLWCSADKASHFGVEADPVILIVLEDEASIQRVVTSPHSPIPPPTLGGI
jgi:hypothetical protein